MASLSPLDKASLPKGTSQQPVDFESAGNGLRFRLVEGESPEDKLNELARQMNVSNPKLALYLTRLIATCQSGNSLDDLHGILSVIAEVQPKDPLETLLVIQMCLATRRAGVAIRDSAKAMLAEDQERQAAIATRLMRLFTQQMETLRKYRGGGNQNITVNYVHAGQAVVAAGGFKK